MTPSLSIRSNQDETVGQRDTASTPDRDVVAADEGGRNAPPLIARLLYGGVLIFTGLNHFRNTESMAGYAESKGVPMADLAVPFTGGMLISGGLGIALWRFPMLAAGAAATFFVGATPTMHDFWNADEEEKQSQMNNFLKNTALFAAAISFLDRADSQ